MKKAPSQPLMTSTFLFLVVVAAITTFIDSSCEAFAITSSKCQHGQHHTTTFRTLRSSSPVMNPRHFHHNILIATKRHKSSTSTIFANRKEEDEERIQNGSKEDPKIEIEKQQQKDFFNIEEPRLLLGDLISLVLTCQLLGLMDVLDKPDFWSNGGFFQSIDLSPTSSTSSISTLGTLVKRDSVMSISWVLSSLKHNGYSLGTIVDDITAIKCSFTILVDYCSLLILFALVTALGTHTSVDAVLILRQSYYTILMLCTFRVVFGKFYNTGGM